MAGRLHGISWVCADSFLHSVRTCPIMPSPFQSFVPTRSSDSGTIGPGGHALSVARGVRQGHGVSGVADVRVKVRSYVKVGRRPRGERAQSKTAYVEGYAHLSALGNAAAVGDGAAREC